MTKLIQRALFLKAMTQLDECVLTLTMKANQLEGQIPR